ncbi:MAG TPA: hypothetical protein VGK30_11665 [Candidatus Binatia bacterium]|jgi:hypothetical protein
MTASVRAMRAAVLALVATLALGGCASYRLLHNGQINAKPAERVKAKLVAVRGLTFRQPVPVEAVSAAQARTMLERELHAQYSSEELATLSRVYATLGLVPAGTDLEKAYLDLYSAQIAGFYDPIDRRMVLVEDAVAPDVTTRILEGVMRRDFAGELVLAHELTHALQDQYYGLDFGRNDLGEDDMQLARHAVYEGDATLAGFAAVLGQLTPSAAVSLAHKLEGVSSAMARAYPQIPAAVRETVVFQYVAGVNFVSWAYQRAGWEGVNAVLAHPPFSTEQLLHPDKYFTRTEYPLSVHVTGVAPYVQDGWQVTENATVGEFLIRVLGEQFLPGPRAQAVAAGWDGDRLLALTRGSDVALVWLTAWDNEAEAAEFFDGYAAILAAKHPGSAPVPMAAPASADTAEPAADATVIASSGNAPYRLERRGAMVLAVEGPLDGDLNRAAERVWRHSTSQRVTPWVPIDLARATP